MNTAWLDTMLVWRCTTRSENIIGTTQTSISLHLLHHPDHIGADTGTARSVVVPERISRRANGQVAYRRGEEDEVTQVPE